MQGEIKKEKTFERNEMLIMNHFFLIKQITNNIHFYNKNTPRSYHIIKNWENILFAIIIDTQYQTRNSFLFHLIGILLLLNWTTRKIESMCVIKSLDFLSFSERSTDRINNVVTLTSKGRSFFSRINTHQIYLLIYVKVTLLK